MLMRRSCPRCHGDLYQDSDPDGHCVRCLQCGNEIQLSRAISVQDSPSLSLFEELRVTADASALEPERRSGRHRIFRALASKGSPVLIAGRPHKQCA